MPINQWDELRSALEIIRAAGGADAVLARLRLLDARTMPGGVLLQGLASAFGLDQGRLLDVVVSFWMAISGEDEWWRVPPRGMCGTHMRRGALWRYFFVEHPDDLLEQATFFTQCVLVLARAWEHARHMQARPWGGEAP